MAQITTNSLLRKKFSCKIPQIPYPILVYCRSRRQELQKSVETEGLNNVETTISLIV